eukprot:1161023-Pelagomonas_calceolata.AAC.15
MGWGPKIPCIYGASMLKVYYLIPQGTPSWKLSAFPACDAACDGTHALDAPPSTHGDHAHRGPLTGLSLGQACQAAQGPTQPPPGGHCYW